MKLTEELLKEMEKKKELYGDGIIMPDGDYRLIQDGQKVVDYDGEKAIIDIRNRLQVGDTMEILVPHQLEPVVFTIDKLWDIDTNEEIEAVSPGVKDQKVKMMLPIKCEKDWILRRKKC